MLHFCTLFNSVYLSRGMAMYESLKKNCENFHLYIFAFDDITYRFFKDNNFDYITPISLQEFEDKDLLRIKPTRTKGEYCWTCTSSTILYVLDHFGVDHCIYVDADLYFFSDPKVLIDEMGDNSVLITEHRYTQLYNKAATSGKYCVQFMLFRNDKRGRKALIWWRERCLEWCFNRMENGKFGDQKYLDDWPERFEGIHVLQHLGGGVAPWNMQQYIFRDDNGKIYGTEMITGRKFDLIFYHFHDLYFVSPYYFSPSNYKILDNHIISLLYRRYIGVIKTMRQTIPLVANSEVYYTKTRAIRYFIFMLMHRGLVELKFLMS